MVGQQGSPSLALALLGSICREKGYEVTAIDATGEDMDQYRPIGDTGFYFQGLSAEEIVARIPQDCAFIGVTCMFSNEWLYHRIVINALTEAFPDSTVVVGGEHATAAGEYVLTSCPGVAACVTGEGEDTLLDLLDALATERSLEEVPGLLIRKDGGGFTRTAPRQRITQLDAMPWPAWDLLPIDNYLDRGAGHGVVGRRTMPMLASRGCPYKCTFCSNPGMWGKLWNARTPQDVVAEMKYYRDTYRADSFSFYDLTAIIRKDWILAFTQELEKEDLGVTWLLPSGTRSEALTDEVVAAMKRTGCLTFNLAPESGSASTLKRIKKQVNLDRMLETVRSCAREGIVVRANIIVGFPDETWGEVRDTLWYIVRMAWAGLDDVGVFPFAPYPGSQLHDDLKAEGAFPDEGEAYDLMLAGNINNNYRSIRSWNKNMSSLQLQSAIIGGAMLFYGCQYLFRPWRLFSSIRRLAAAAPVTFLERVTYTGAMRVRRMVWASRTPALEPPRPPKQSTTAEQAVYDHTG